MKNNIVLIGLPGCGKTTLGTLLSQRLSLKFIDIDRKIEADSQQKISQLFEKGESYFRDIETSVTRQVANERKVVISTGGGVVLRPENMEALSENGLILFLSRSMEDITGDIEIEARPLLKDGVERLKKIYDDRIHLYEKYADITIENNLPLEQMIQQIIESLPEDFLKGVTHENNHP